jgi:hypothetical protein
MERRRIPILAIVMLAFLISFGIALVSWSAGNRTNSSYEHAVAQARYLARQGIMERGLTYLRSLKPSQLPDHRVDLPIGQSLGGGRYKDVYIIPGQRPAGIQVGEWLPSFEVHATGLAHYESDNGESLPVIRTENLRVRLESFSSFSHLTDSEHSIFGEHLKLMTPDSIYGHIHSNDYFYIGTSLTIFGLLTTSAPNYVLAPGAYNPYFVNYEPQFNVSPIDFPAEVPRVRSCARASGLEFDGEGIYVYRVLFEGQDGIRVDRHVIGAPENDSLIF